MSSDHKLHLIAFSEKGVQLMQALAGASSFQTHCYDGAAVKAGGGVGRVAGSVFQAHVENPQALVFICAAGIAVRAIAPYVADKLSDPPVIVIDDCGRFVISLLSGHLGRANALTKQIAKVLQEAGFEAVSVVTTATDSRGLEGFEAVLTHYKVPITAARGDLKTLNMTIANGETIGLYIDPWLKSEHVKQINHFGDAIKTYDDFDAFNAHQGKRVLIALRKPEAFRGITPDFVYYSKCIVVGTGCKRGVTASDYEKALEAALDTYAISKKALCTFASIALKSDEPCIRLTAETLDCQCHFWDAEAIAAVESQFEGSDFVKRTVGVSAVAGPSAYLLTHDTLSKNTIRRRQCTFAFGRLSI
ncbi:MAG: cobalt-precorrin hydrolase [Clostridiales bacterium]|jgi:cobalt-precorrin 5A hydrolase|nr:cobalt-precorrin hydrolase [Clostridiales bacterium]